MIKLTDKKVLTLHERIAEEQAKHANNVYGIEDMNDIIPTVAIDTSDMDQIKLALQDIINKVHSLDLYVRQQLHTPIKPHYKTAHEKNYDDEYKKYIGSDFLIEKL